MRKQVTHQISIAGKVYPRGMHDFPESVMAHEHFKLYSKAGKILTPAGDSSGDKFKTAAAVAQRQEMEAKFGVPQKSAVAPSSADVKIEAIGNSGFEPKVEEVADEAPQGKSKHKGK